MFLNAALNVLSCASRSLPSFDLFRQSLKASGMVVPPTATVAFPVLAQTTYTFYVGSWLNRLYNDEGLAASRGSGEEGASRLRPRRRLPVYQLGQKLLLLRVGHPHHICHRFL